MTTSPPSSTIDTLAQRQHQRHYSRHCHQLSISTSDTSDMTARHSNRHFGHQMHPDVSLLRQYVALNATISYISPIRRISITPAYTVVTAYTIIALVTSPNQQKPPFSPHFSTLFSLSSTPNHLKPTFSTPIDIPITSPCQQQPHLSHSIRPPIIRYCAAQLTNFDQCSSQRQQFFIQPISSTPS